MGRFVPEKSSLRFFTPEQPIISSVRLNRQQRRASTKLRKAPSGRPAEAATGAILPDAAEELRTGLSHHRAGRLEAAEACYRSVLAAQPDHADTLHLLGLIAHRRGQQEQAIELIGRAIKQKGQVAAYLCSLGVVFYDQGKLDQAIAAHQQAIQTKPDYAEAYYNLGNALKMQCRLDDACAAYRNAIRVKPEYADAHCNLGAVLVDQGKPDAAITACQQAIALKPDLPTAQNNLAMALQQLGRLPEARAAMKQAIRSAPRNAKYRRNHSDITRFVAGDHRLTEMERLADECGSFSVGEQIDLHFALGKAYEDVGRHAEAFRQWLDGNALKRQQIVYNEAAVLGMMDGARSEFTSDLIRTWQNTGNPSPLPVFILGMMRSGSTLVEQILASHPQVFGGGELAYFPKAVQELRTKHSGPAAPPEALSALTGEDYRDLGTRYLAEIEQLAPSAGRITDKAPINFMFAGLIHLALPNAPIIHTFRDPVDTCVSCFSKLFNDDQGHTFDLAELGRYYRHYRTLMAHWRRVLPPGRILHVRYEDVVADLEGQARRIVAHCGLDWDARCLAFHQSERPVRTASSAQVRQPIYNNAIGRSRVYTEFLAPLLAEFNFSDAGFVDGFVAD